MESLFAALVLSPPLFLVGKGVFEFQMGMSVDKNSVDNIVSSLVASAVGVYVSTLLVRVGSGVQFSFLKVTNI